MKISAGVLINIEGKVKSGRIGAVFIKPVKTPTKRKKEP